MAHTVNSIVINASYDRVFDISNDISRWGEFFGEYGESKIIEKKGNKITFRLSHKNGTSWKSFRLLFKEYGFAYAERIEPMFPFEYMKIIWLYRQLPEGVEMRWIEDFKMAQGADFDDRQAEEFINDHSKKNLMRFKEIIENTDVQS